MTEPSSGGYQVKIVVTTQTNYGVEDEEQYFIITDDNINIFKWITENDATCGETLIDTFNIGRLNNGDYTLILSLYDNNSFNLDSNIVSTTFTLGGPAFIDRTENSHDIVLFPNPAHSTIVLLSEDLKSIMSIRLINSMGRAVKVYNSPDPVLDLKGISPGFYLVQMYTVTGIYSKKILIEQYFEGLLSL